jgi:hypothetical protein
MLHLFSSIHPSFVHSAINSSVGSLSSSPQTETNILERIKFYREELPPTVVCVIKLRKLSWAGHIIIIIYDSTVLLLDPGHFFSFLILYTVGRTTWTGDQPVARPLPTHRTTQT